MEEKNQSLQSESKKESNKVIFIIIGILVVVVIALVVFLLTKDNKQESKSSNSNSTINESNSNSNDDIKVETEIIEETNKLMMLFPPIEKAYQNKLLIAKDFEVEDLYANTMLTIGKYYNDGIYYLDMDAETKTTDNGCIDGSIRYESFGWGMCYSKNPEEKNDEEIAVDEKTFQKYFESFYGNIIKYKKLDSFSTLIDFINYEYYDGYYFGYVGGGGYAFGDGMSLPSIVFQKEENVGEEKNIYVYYAYAVLSCKDEECNDATVNLYKDASKKEKIGEVKYNDDFSFNTSASLVKDKAPLYKHTYKKNTDGSYYWYSVEPVK